MLVRISYLVEVPLFPELETLAAPVQTKEKLSWCRLGYDTVTICLTISVYFEGILCVQVMELCSKTLLNTHSVLWNITQSSANTGTKPLDQTSMCIFLTLPLAMFLHLVTVSSPSTMARTGFQDYYH